MSLIVYRSVDIIIKISDKYFLDLSIFQLFLGKSQLLTVLWLNTVIF